MNFNPPFICNEMIGGVVKSPARCIFGNADFMCSFLTKSAMETPGFSFLYQIF